MTSPIAAYDNKVLLGAMDGYVHAFYAQNGTAAWAGYANNPPVMITVAGGSLAVKTSTNTIVLLSQLGSTANQLWSTTPSSPPVSALASRGSALYFGTAASANAIYLNGTKVPGFSGGPGR